MTWQPLKPQAALVTARGMHACSPDAAPLAREDSSMAMYTGSIQRRDQGWQAGAVVQPALSAWARLVDKLPQAPRFLAFVWTCILAILRWPSQVAPHHRPCCLPARAA